jgi:hypothetical protein
MGRSNNNNQRSIQRKRISKLQKTKQSDDNNIQRKLDQLERQRARVAKCRSKKNIKSAKST